MIHLGIDISSIPYNRGVSRYTSNLVAALAERQTLAMTLYGVAWSQFAVLEKFAHTIPGADSQLLRQPPQLHGLSWQIGLQPILKTSQNIDIFHSWDWQQPPDRQLPLVSTIHDLAMLRFPETAHPTILAKHKRSWDILKKRQAQIIAVSHATKKDIVELLQIDPQRISVIHEALPIEVRKAADALSDDELRRIIQRYQLHKPFLLFVGTTEPRKNLKRVIEAWQPLAKSLQLIIAGDKGWDDLEPVVQKLTYRPVFLGKVSDAVLAALYHQAELFIYPSLYEGFGLPILEAFAHGTPVVTSNISSLPEVAGNAAELVDPMSAESIYKGIVTILNEDIPSQKIRLQKMIIRLHSFSWEKAAVNTELVYQQLYNERH